MDINSVIDQISSKTGISKDQAKTAFITSVDFLKTKLPAPIAQQLSSLVEGKDANFQDIGNSIKNKFF